MMSIDSEIRVMGKVSIGISLKTQGERIFRTFVVGRPKEMHDDIDTLTQWFCENIRSWLKTEIEAGEDDQTQT